jgi:PAS domain S-box-containing protein
MTGCERAMAGAYDEELFEALGAVLQVLETGRDRVDVVAARAATLRAGRDRGLSYAELLTGTSGPLELDVLAELLDGLFEAGSRLRRAEARALHADGLSMDKVAGLLHVSRQRVSAIINSPIGQPGSERGEVQGRREGISVTDAEFRLLAESLPYLVWIAGPDGGTQYLNQQGINYTGLPRQANYDWSWVTLVHPDDREFAERGWRQATTTGMCFDLDYRIRRADGQYRWHHFQSLPIRGSDGQPVKWIGTAIDVEDFKRLEAEVARLQESPATTALDAADLLNNGLPQGP